MLRTERKMILLQVSAHTYEHSPTSALTIIENWVSSTIVCKCDNIHGNYWLIKLVHGDNVELKCSRDVDWIDDLRRIRRISDVSEAVAVSEASSKVFLYQNVQVLIQLKNIDGLDIDRDQVVYSGASEGADKA